LKSAAPSTRSGSQPYAATELDGEQQAMGGTAGNENKLTLTIREPIGVVSSISAFNHPVNLIAHQVAPALAAGTLSILPCEPPVAEQLASDPRINYLSFIGSAKVGWHLRRAAAAGTRMGLEHGGNAPAIVAADADLEKTARICLTGGQPLDNNCYALSGAKPGMDVVDKEVFGPVVALFVYDELDEAIAAANAGPNGFQAAVFTRAISTAFDAARRLDFTAVMVNDSTAFRVDWMPFGGRHQSGLGMGGVKYSIEEMTVPKLIVLNL
jgi:acyl-CoA reductase-like NAD-dependent aldehyde dehydrogenase